MADAGATASPHPFTPPRLSRSWRVVLADGSASVVVADCIRIEGGALVVMKPGGTVAAFAPGRWLSVEEIEVA